MGGAATIMLNPQNTGMLHPLLFAYYNNNISKERKKERK
jgi:hypothetical protein